MVRPPFHVSACPSPALGLGWFGHRSVAPPAAPVCWALLESRLRRSDALASGRTLSFYFLAWVFFTGRLLGLGLVGCNPAGVPTFFWGRSPSLVLVFAGRFLPFGCPGSWYFLGIFTWASVCCWLEVVKVNPWLSTLRGLAVAVVHWFLSGTCQLALVGLQCLWIPWSGGVSGLHFGSPVSGRVCVLPQSAIVTLLSLRWVGLTFGFCVGSPTSG